MQCSEHIFHSKYCTVESEIYIIGIGKYIYSYYCICILLYKLHTHLYTYMHWSILNSRRE